jgi:hypothetical protein
MEMTIVKRNYYIFILVDYTKQWWTETTLVLGSLVDVW